MQCHHGAHPDSIRCGTSRGAHCYRCQACRRIFQTRRRGKDPALKPQTCPLYLEGMGMRTIGRVLGIHNDVRVSLKLHIHKLNNPKAPKPGGRGGGQK